MKIGAGKTLLSSAIMALLFAGNAAAGQGHEQVPDDEPQSGQEPEGGQQSVRQLDAVVVTARRREESLQDVPVAVSVIDRQQLENGLAFDFTKAAELVPQVSMSQGGSSTGAVITVRGISSASSDAGLDQSVAIEFDGVPVSRGEVISAALFDMDQIQVLQGPQALFFGKNSPAGVISLQSADPTDSFEGYATLGYEFETDQKYVEGAISGPLSDTFKARLAVRGSEREGWLRNVAPSVPYALDPTVTVPGATMGNRGPDDDIKAARLTLLWEPSDDFSANLKLMHNVQKRNSGNASTEPFCIGSTTIPVLLGSIPIPGGDCEKNKRKAHGSVPVEYTVNVPHSNGGVPYFDSRFTFGALKLDKNLGALDLVSTTGYYDQTRKGLSVSDWSTYASIWATDRHTYKLWTQELRLSSDFEGPVNFMAGAYYEDYQRSFWNAVDLFHTWNPDAQNYLSNILDSVTNGNYYSFFGQINWRIAPNVELTAGARYSRDEKTTELVNLLAGPGMPTLRPENDVLTADYSDSHVSPEATISWHPAEGRTLYAAYKTGYKSGGTSVPFFVYDNNTPENMRFEPEEANGFEVGYKAEALDRALRFDLAAYRYNYDDLQVVSYNGDTISFTIGNAARARIEGVQGAFQWLAADGLTLRGNMGYNRARYADYSNAQCYAGQTAAEGCVDGQQDLTGKTLLRAPKLTYSLGADYSPLIVQGWNTVFSFSGAYSGGFQTATDYAPAGLQSSYWLVNASIRLAPDDWRWELALIGRNLTDSYYMLNSNGWSGSSNPDQQIGWFNPPREVALQATLRF